MAAENQKLTMNTAISHQLVADQKPNGNIEEPSSRKHSMIREFYSQASVASSRAKHTVMQFLKSCNGIGVFLGLTCALSYSLGSLIVKILNSNYQMHPFMLSAIRQGFLFFLAAPQVAFCQAPYFGRTKSDWLFLVIRATCGGVAITLNFLALSHMSLGDVGVIFAVTPAFTTLFAWIILRERCHVSDVPVLTMAFLGVAFILRPPFIFNVLFPGMVHSNKDVSAEDRLKGSLYALSGAIIQAGLYLALRKMRKVNYASISFFYALSTAPILLAVTIGIGKLEMPPCYLDRIMAIGIAVSAQGGHVFMTLAAKFVPPGIVSLTRSSEVAFNFLWQVAFLGAPVNPFSMIGLALVTISMGFLSIRQVLTEKYKEEKPKSKFVRLLLIISR